MNWHHLCRSQYPAPSPSLPNASLPVAGHNEKQGPKQTPKETCRLLQGPSHSSPRILCFWPIDEETGIRRGWISPWLPNEL